MTHLDSSLISITEMVSIAKSRGVNFGVSDPREHIFYLSKIGVLPRSIRKKNAVGKLEAHYPRNTVDHLVKIFSLKKSGLAYSQMGRFSKLTDQVVDHFIPRNPNVTVPTNVPLESTAVTGGSSNFIYLTLGIVLGFLINTNVVSGNRTLGAQASSSTTSETMLNTESSLGASTVFRVLTSAESSNNNDVYLVTIPKSNFGKLEKVQLSDLAKPDNTIKN